MPTKKKIVKPKKVKIEKNKEPTKRIRKKKGESYFGREEEEAVVRFLKASHREKNNFVANKSNTIVHDLGSNITVKVFYIKPNENAYGSDSKFIIVDVDVIITNLTNVSVDIKK